MERQRSQTPISENTVARLREDLLDIGMFYMVPPSKHHFYGDDLRTIAVPEATLPYVSSFLIEGESKIAIDLEEIIPLLIPSEEVGMGESFKERIQRGLGLWIDLADRLTKLPEWLQFLRQIVSAADQSLLEIPEFNPEVPRITKATITRLDLLLTEDGRALICDPNLMPIGYPTVRQYLKGLEKEVGTSLGFRSDYENGIADLVASNSRPVSGILTSLNYPIWSSHLTLAREIRQVFGLPFYCIPVECFGPDSGKVDTELLSRFNNAFGIDNSLLDTRSEEVPGLVIRYSRENKVFDSRTVVVNAPGIRLIETQLWSALFNIKGFSEIASAAGFSDEELVAIREVFVPSVLMRIDGEELMIATRITQDLQGAPILTWEPLAQNLEIMANLFESIKSTEKSNETSWFIKTLSTSGKKGVRFTGDGRIDQAPKNILKEVKRANLGVFIVQPKIRSVINLNGEENRLKGEMFVSAATGKTVAADYMATPINQRAAHGGSATKLGFILP